MSYFCSLYSILKKVKLFEQRNIVIYSIFTIIYFFIFVPPILSQVKIKESIVISPHNITSKYVNSFASNSHTIKLVGNWEQIMLGPEEDIPMNRQRFKVHTSCSEDIYSDFDYSGNTEFSFSALYGNDYYIEFLNSQRSSWDPVYRYEAPVGGHFDIYIDGQLHTSANNYTNITPWFSSIGFQIYGSNIDHGSSLNLNIVKVKSCEPIIGNMNNDWPEISIISGGEYLSFYDEENDDTLGNSLYLGDFISNIPKLIYDSPYYKDGELDGILQAELNGTFAFDTVGINKADDFELIVDIEPEELRPGESADIYLLQDLGFTVEQFSEGQLFDVNIIEGSQFGTLVAPNGVDTAVNFRDILQGFTFRANENITDSAEVYIKVSTVLEGGVIIVARDNLDKLEMSKTSNVTKNDAVNPDVSSTNLSGNHPNWIIIPPEENREIYGIAGVKIFDKDSLDHFELCIKPDSLAIKDTIAFTESAKLFVTAKDADSNSIEIDTSKMLSFEITSMDDYGTFISPNGDTLCSNQTSLTNISYGKAKSGKVRFVALFENPDSIINCNIKVSLQDDTSKNGERDAVVLEQTLKIMMVGQYEVQPIITSAYNDYTRTDYITAIDEENRKPFRIKISRGSKIVKNHRVKLHTNYIDGSGGHNHLEPRRPYTNTDQNIAGRIRRINYGSFYSFVSGETFNANFMRGRTYIRAREDTVSRFEYIASIWGDSMKIYLESLDNLLLKKDSVIIAEKVPNLVELGTGENYVLVGGTCNHHGPNDRSYPDSCSTPNNNHFATVNTRNSIVNIANAWHEEYADQPVLRINDISLPSGGKFDVNGNWSGSHSTHREGRDVDVRTGLYYYSNIGNVILNRSGVIVRTPTTEPFNLQNGGGLNPKSTLCGNSTFERICETNNAVAHIHGRDTTNEHYHIDFNN